MKHKYHWLAAILIGAVFIRLQTVASVMTSNGAMFLGPDSWYHVRLARYAADGHLMSPLVFDNLNGGAVGYMPLLSLSVAWLSKVFSFIPLDIIASIFPVAVSIFCILAVYLLALKLFKKDSIALMSAGLMAFLPSEFLYRSLFGVVDHHVLEVLFTVLTLWAFASRWWLLAGFFTGLLLISWQGGILLVAILMTYWIAGKLWHYIKGDKGNWSNYVFNIGRGRAMLFYLVTALAVSLITLTYLNQSVNHKLAIELIISMVAVVAINNLPYQRINRYGRIAVLVSLIGIIAFMAFRYHYGEWTVANYFRLELRNVFWGWKAYIQEVEPMTAGVWFSNYGIAGLLFIFGMVSAIKSKVNGLFLFWSGVMLLANIGQRRWGYYFVVPVSLFTAYFINLLWQNADRLKLKA